MTRQSFKFADWSTAPDPDAAAEYVVICRDVVKHDDDPEHDTPCRWEFRALDDRAAADKQQKAHTDKEGHRLFLEISTCPTVVTPPPGSVLAGRLARRERAVAQ
ncbi:DUF7848 domain-containing protein [Streptomyces sp. NPDC002537]